MKLDSIVLDEPKLEDGGEETEAAKAKLVLIDKAVTAEVRDAKNAKETKIATKVEGDSVRETITLVMVEINEIVEAVNASSIPIAVPKK